MANQHDELKELIAPYVIGALPPEEESAIRSHILGCEECLSEADSYSTVASSLVFAVEPESPPEGFAERTLARVAEESPGGARARAARWPWLQALSYASLLVAAVVLGLALLQTRSELEDQQETLAALVGGDGLVLTGEDATARLVPTSEGSLLVATGLDEPAEGRIYQLWLLKDGEAISAGTFDVSGRVTVVRTPARLRGHQGAAVTPEPRPDGSAQPTSEPVIESA